MIQPGQYPPLVPWQELQSTRALAGAAGSATLNQPLLRIFLVSNLHTSCARRMTPPVE